MKVTFDSNVWQLVVAPEEATLDPDNVSFAKIHAAITDGRITPFLSETIFSLEGITKKDRKDFFGDYKGKVARTQQTLGNTVGMNFSLGSNEEAHPGNNEFLDKYLALATPLGFKLIHAPRIGGVVNKDVKPHLLHLDGAALKDYIDRGQEAGGRIDELGSGMAALMKVLAPYPRPRNGSIHDWIAKAPAAEAKSIATAIAEWADGDSVAAHVGIRGDYFCTRDGAKGAGQSSILSAKNVEIMAREFEFQKVTPSELAALL